MNKVLLTTLAAAAAAAGAAAYKFKVEPEKKLGQIREKTRGMSPTAKYDQFKPDTDEIMGFASDLINIGRRIPGTEGGREAQEYVRGQFEKDGLQDVQIIPSRNDRWICDQYGLTVGGEEIPCYYISYTFCGEEYGDFSTPEGGIDTEMVYVGDGRERDFRGLDVSGKIVVSNVRFGRLPYAGMKLMSEILYDPDGTLPLTGSAVDPYSPKTFPYNYERAKAGGAAGFIGILTDYFDSCTYNNEDYSYECGSMDIPGLWVTQKTGEKLKATIKTGGGRAQAVMSMSGTKTRVDAGAVVGILPGKSDETIMVHSHYDSVTAGATEDGSGMAVVLAMAKFFSQIPYKERDRTVMFVGTDTHFTDYDTHDAFAEKYLDEHANILCDICVEHVAKDMEVNEEGDGVLTGLVAPRLFFASDDGEILKITKEEIVRHRLDRSVVVAAGDSEDIVTDADMFYRTGIKVISMVSGQMYLYDENDTIDKIPAEQMKSVMEAFSDILWRVMRLDRIHLERDMVKCFKSRKALHKQQEINHCKEKAFQEQGGGRWAF